MAKAIKNIAADEQIEIDGMPCAGVLIFILCELHDSNTAFIPVRAPADCGEYECGANNKSAVTSVNKDLIDYLYLLLCLALKVLGWHHITLEKTIIHKTEGRCMHGFTRLKAVGNGITAEQISLLASFQRRFMLAVYPLDTDADTEIDGQLREMGCADNSITGLWKEMEGRAFKFLVKHGDHHLSAPIRVSSTDGEFTLNKNFLPLPYRPEEHVSEQVTVLAKGIRVEPEEVDLALKTTGVHLDEKQKVAAQYCLGSQWNSLIEAMRGKASFVVTLHTTMHSDGTNSGWVIASIDEGPQTELLPEENDN